MSRKAHKFEASGDFAEHLEGGRRREMIPVESVIPRMNIREQDSVADLGAGTGYFTLPMASMCGEVIAVDMEPKMLAFLKDRAFEEAIDNVSLVKGEITSLPLASESVDRVMAAFVYHEVESQDRLLRECHRVLRPSGSLTVIDFQKRLMRYGPPIWVRKRPEHVLSTGTGMFRLEDRFDARAYYQLRLRKV